MSPPIDTELRYLTRDQILAHARARGGRMRVQRQMGRVIAAVALLGIASVPVLRAAAESTSNKVHTFDQRTTTTTEADQALGSAETTTTIGAGPVTTLPNALRPTVTAPGITTTTTTTTEPPLPSRACSGKDITFTVDTDKPSYGVGETVTATARLRNNTDHRCYLPDQAGFHVQDANGKALGGGQNVIIDYTSEAAFEGGETMTREFQWNQRCLPGDGCTGDLAPRGTYTAIATMSAGSHSYGVAETDFELTSV